MDATAPATTLALVVALSAAAPAVADHDGFPGETEATVPQDGPAYVHHESWTHAEVFAYSCNIPAVQCPWVDFVQFDQEASVYREANGCDGFQESASDCDDDGDLEGPDEEVETVGVGNTIHFPPPPEYPPLP